MTDLAILTLCLAGALTAIYAAMVFAPALFRDWARRFPRSRVAGWALTVVAVAWSGKLLYDGPLGRLEPYRDWLFALVPLAIILVGVFVDELLAPRAMGGLLILIPAPLLDAARWHPSPLRYVVIVIAYVMVIKGCVLVVAPYVARKRVERMFGEPRQVRLWGSAGLAVSLLLVGLGLWAY